MPPRKRWRSRTHAGLGFGSRGPRGAGPTAPTPSTSAHATNPLARTVYHQRCWVTGGRRGLADWRVADGTGGRDRNASRPASSVTSAVVVHEQPGDAGFGDERGTIRRSGDERGLGQDLGPPRRARDDRDRREPGVGRLAGLRVDEVMHGTAAPTPGPTESGAGGDGALADHERAGRPGLERILDVDRPGPALRTVAGDAHVATEVGTHADRSRCERSSAASRSAASPLPIPPRSSVVPTGRVTAWTNRSRVMPLQPEAGPVAVDRGTVGGHRTEVAVVPEREQRGEHGRIEATTRRVPGLDGSRRSRRTCRRRPRPDVPRSGSGGRARCRGGSGSTGPRAVRGSGARGRRSHPRPTAESASTVTRTSVPRARHARCTHGSGIGSAVGAIGWVCARVDRRGHEVPPVAGGGGGGGGGSGAGSGVGGGARRPDPA